MIDRFTVPKTKEEFLERVGPVTVPGAKAVLNSIDLKLKQVSGPLMNEKEFFEDAIEYKRSGKIPERLTNA